MNKTVLAVLALLVIAMLWYAISPSKPHAELAPAGLQEAAALSVSRYNSGCGDDVKPPEIWLDDIEGPEVGVARWWEWRVLLKRSVVKSRPEIAARSTVPHEVAHLLVHRRFGDNKEPHGPEFRQMEAYLTGVLSECPWKR